MPNLRIIPVEEVVNTELEALLDKGERDGKEEFLY